MSAKTEPTIYTFNGKSGIIELPNIDFKISKQQQRYLNLAAKMAELSEVEKRHGAVIVKSGSVLAVGINKWRNREMVTSESYNPNLTTHAEIDALNKVGNAEGAVIYVARISKSGKPVFSKPCVSCQRALDEAKVKKIIYTI